MKIVYVVAVIFPVVMLVANADYKSATVGQSFYLREKDILSPLLGGVHIFKKLDDCCYQWRKQQVTIDHRSAYKDTDSFYNQIASDSSLSLKLTGVFTMGATLNVKTRSMSSGSTDIKGESINVGTYVNTSYINQECFKGSTSELTDDVINMFDTLPFNIQNPWLSGSWAPYETFLKTFGSHFVTATRLGVVVRQWTFSKAESGYTSKQLNIRACVDFAGPTRVGLLQSTACSGINKTDENSVAHLETSNYLEIQGGSDETRNRYRTSRSQEDLNQLLNEGRAMQSPTSYEYMAIWDILMIKFYDHSTRFAKAMNLMHYYQGYADFGCSYLANTAGDLKLRAFDYSEVDSTPTIPVFQCTLINEGCQSDNDCHIPTGSVTYCYGNSCYEYEKPAFGSKAQSVKPRRTKSGSYYEGVNLSCYYYLVSGRCDFNYFDKKLIWDGHGLVQNAMLQQLREKREVCSSVEEKETQGKHSSASKNLWHSKLYFYFIFISYTLTKGCPIQLRLI